MFKFGKKSEGFAQGVNPHLLECARLALSECKTYDQSIQWRGGVRTSEQQNEIFKRGASKKDGYEKKSIHQSGNALDVAPVGIIMSDLDLMVKGKKVAHPGFREFASNMFSTWQSMLKAGEAKGTLEWGGNWKTFIDLPHWQVN